MTDKKETIEVKFKVGEIMHYHTNNGDATAAVNGTKVVPAIVTRADEKKANVWVFPDAGDKPLKRTEVPFGEQKKGKAYLLPAD